MVESDGIVPTLTNWQDAFAQIEPQITADGVHDWQFDPLLPIDVRSFVFGNQRMIRMNRHDYFELMVVVEGRVSFRVHDCAFSAQAGELVVIGNLHYHTVTGSGPNHGGAKACVLYFLRDVLLDHDRKENEVEYLVPFALEGSKSAHCVDARSGTPREVYALMQRIRQQLPADTRLKKLTAITCLKMALVVLLNHHASRRVKMELFDRRQQALEQLEPLFQHIERNLSAPLRVSEAAHLVKMSTSRFTTFFRNTTGQSFVEYLTRYRVARAQELLRSTERTLADVGNEVGFCDQSYFGLVFKRLSGMTPKGYRRKARQEMTRS